MARTKSNKITIFHRRKGKDLFLFKRRLHQFMGHPLHSFHLAYVISEFLEGYFNLITYRSSTDYKIHTIFFNTVGMLNMTYRL